MWVSLGVLDPEFFLKLLVPLFGAWNPWWKDFILAEAKDKAAWCVFFFEKKNGRAFWKPKVCGPKKTMQTQSQSAFRGVAAGIEPCRWISFFFWSLRACLDVPGDGSGWINGERISGLFHLLVNGVFLGVYNPLILTIDPNFLRQPSGGTPWLTFTEENWDVPPPPPDKYSSIHPLQTNKTSVFHGSSHGHRAPRCFFYFRRKDVPCKAWNAIIVCFLSLPWKFTTPKDQPATVTPNNNDRHHHRIFQHSINSIALAFCCVFLFYSQKIQ